MQISQSRIITGIDLGTHEAKIVVADSTHRDERGFPKIIISHSVETKGVRHGYIANTREATQTIRELVLSVEKKIGLRIKRAFVSVGGIGLGSIISNGSVSVSRADSEITELDIKNSQSESEKSIPSQTLLNKKILHSIPLEYKIDGKHAFGNPEGMRGGKIEVKMLYITCLEHHLNDLIQAMEDAGVEVEDVMASPIASSLVTLSKTQKIAGCVLANIGSETVSITVFENNIPISLEVFPIGSTDITNDIALGLKVSLEEAEQIKIGAVTGASYSRKKLEEIISARVSDIFELIEEHLKKIGRSGLLPAGIVITGGASGLHSIEELAKNSLKLPSRIGHIGLSINNKSVYKDSLWSVAYGLTVWGIHADRDGTIDGGSRIIKIVWRKIKTWFEQFMP